MTMRINHYQTRTPTPPSTQPPCSTRLWYYLMDFQRYNHTPLMYQLALYRIPPGFLQHISLFILVLHHQGTLNYATHDHFQPSQPFIPITLIEYLMGRTLTDEVLLLLHALRNDADPNQPPVCLLHNELYTD